MIDIETAAEEATADAKTIQQIKDRVENQRDTIDEAFKHSKEALMVSQQASNKVMELSVTLDKANGSLSNLNELIEFTSLIAKAQTGDRESFYLLLNPTKTAIPTTSTFYQGLIGGLVCKIESDALREMDGTVGTDWKAVKIESDKCTIDDFIKYYGKYQFLPSVRTGILRYLYSSPRFSERQKFDFYAMVIRSDKNLVAVHCACKCMDDKARIGKNFIGGDGYLKWYEEHKGELKTTL
jgi:cellobiose-specific phosphotransferase system component IIA